MGKLLLSDYIKVYDKTLSPQQCEVLIARFEASPDQHQVQQRDDAYSFVQLDVTAAWPDVDLEIQRVLVKAFNQYQESLGIRRFWPDTFGQEALRLKRYLPNGRDGFGPHVDTRDAATSTRFATGILYLNEPGGGETVFLDLDIAIPPAPGRLLLFPPLWTYAHAGQRPRDRPKYILHSYLRYLPPE